MKDVLFEVFREERHIQRSDFRRDNDHANSEAHRLCYSLDRRLDNQLMIKLRPTLSINIFVNRQQTILTCQSAMNLRWCLISLLVRFVVAVSGHEMGKGRNRLNGEHLRVSVGHVSKRLKNLQVLNLSNRQMRPDPTSE